MPVEIHRSTIDAATSQAARRWAERVGNRVVNEAKKRCPVDEGALRISITHVTTIDSDRAKIVIGSPLDYAEYVHTGTGIYGPKGTPIVPTKRQALKFRWEPTTGGAKKKLPVEKRGWTFAKSVKGMEPKPFLAEALTAVMGTITRTRSR